ncbi:hypothetical protein L873DRAFT_923138 [Choiromyces venosus 120613-1]|uniref:Uncharacterized protein n=1 Tax=Choiromyces venosus 120613-1 TaxID=1336337 RepID=A0A3N4JMA6_9PEZI|nr:hypothetical protein L873DRAFT_923138 [Choiromyces venosus 120613-1]
MKWERSKPSQVTVYPLQERGTVIVKAKNLNGEFSLRLTVIYSAEDQNLRRSGRYQRRKLIYLRREISPNSPPKHVFFWLRHKRQRRAGVARLVPWVEGRESSKGRTNNETGPSDVTQRNIREGSSLRPPILTSNHDQKVFSSWLENSLPLSKPIKESRVTFQGLNIGWYDSTRPCQTCSGVGTKSGNSFREAIFLAKSLAPEGKRCFNQ